MYFFLFFRSLNIIDEQRISYTNIIIIDILTKFHTFNMGTNELTGPKKPTD